jgi:hypothetical protein
MNLRDLILSAPLPREEVPVPEWGVSVFVRTMTGTERERFEEEHLKAPDTRFGARLMVATLSDGDGQAIFTEADIASVAETSSVVIARLIPIAMRMNALGKSDMETLEKNS